MQESKPMFSSKEERENQGMSEPVTHIEIDNERIFRVYVSDDKGMNALLQTLRESMNEKPFMFKADIRYVNYKKIQDD